MAAIRLGLFQSRPVSDALLKQTYFGVEFPNPLGLAAGFDKNAIAVDQWDRLGFGYVECGTVTHLAQPGNPRPRLFRLAQDEALINRMGFNNDGASVVATRLASAKSKIPVGVNLGKSKITELADAAKDYQDSFRLLRRFGNYFVINVSSPNTKGLRALQERGPLKEIIDAMREVDSSPPLFVKIAPDLEWSIIDDVIDLSLELGLTGIVTTNTTIGRKGLTQLSKEEGGLSGRPLKNLSDEILSYVYQQTRGKLLLIGVGGISTGDDLHEKISLGANLCQVYTGWVYGGPQMIPDALERLVFLMKRDGIGSLEQLRGSRSLPVAH